MTSPYCLLELEYACLLGKRVIPINQRVIYNTVSQPLSDSNQQMMLRFYQFYNLPNQNIRTTQDVLDRSHALLGKIDRLDAKEIFICASTADKIIRNALLGSLSRYAKTVWTHDRDIQKGTDYQQAIKIGIENADNFIFFISQNSVTSEHCQRELAYALQYNKRVIPLLIMSIPDSEIPEGLRALQYIDFTENHRETGLDEILVILQHDHEYYEWHKCCWRGA
ncbi:MAG: hypothetical protein DRR16_01630 [Candidatus Parabeggiatoa sp. nov. 3]|nr:MAG: hypothetical protein DRR00_03915 [Gammaproteobacteria bacterium]RKZ68622.1 MAG: hypothetical protein DRQ99_03235 [Gammaproteobacteria bacterium]RKZ89817.1 MAG: hypothetical protein DRR16_01630 [Gammaproteobacteria bacterium]